MARYLIVKVEDDSRGPDNAFVRVRRALHEFPEVSDMGVAAAAGLTDSERSAVVDAFENAMRRAKAAQKAIEEDRALTPEGYKWVSCGLAVNWSVGQYRHLVKGYRLTLLCGATASHAEIWRRNSVKEKCPECLALSEDLA